MPEHIRALVVILLLSLIAFAITRKLAYEVLSPAEFKRRRNLWLGFSSFSFLVPNFWLIIIAIAVFSYLASKKDKMIAGLFIFLIFILPSKSSEMGSIGSINLFAMTPQRAIIMAMLLPLFFKLFQQNDTPALGKLTADKFVIAYLLLAAILNTRDNTITDVLRDSFVLFIDIFLPYYIFSRTIRTREDIKQVIMSLVIAAVILSLITMFESIKHWHLYTSIMNYWDVGSGGGAYLQRADLLRPKATIGPIPLGFTFAVAFGLFLALSQSFTSKKQIYFIFFLLGTGLILSLSRGPWVGGAFIVALFILTGKNGLKRLTLLTLLAVLLIPVVSLLPYGDKLTALIPFYGDDASGTIDYRQRLLQQSAVLIKQNPLFGKTKVLQSPELEELRQGQGIIDIVNTFVSVVLSKGLVGLMLFVGAFLAVVLGLIKTLGKISDPDSFDKFAGRSLLATTLGIMLIIFTVSSVSVIPLLYWSVLGLGVAYIHVMKSEPVAEDLEQQAQSVKT